jgi:hypothetical protein
MMPSTMPDLDQRVRVAAFDWLDHQRQLHGDTLPRTRIDLEQRAWPTAKTAWFYGLRLIVATLDRCVQIGEEPYEAVRNICR